MRLLVHYARAFMEIAKSQGVLWALRRSFKFLRNRYKAKLGTVSTTSTSRKQSVSGEPPVVSQMLKAVGSLDIVKQPKPLLLIVSDIQIRQCVQFRIDQKVRLLKSLGLAVIFVPKESLGRFRSFSQLAHTIIVYRTFFNQAEISSLKENGARVIFEFDDLIVDPSELENSGILDQIGQADALHLRSLSTDLLSTALACDAVIVSTEHLKEIYSSENSKLKDKDIFVLPNFLENSEFLVAAEKKYDFAYTSPSESVRSEVKMLKEFLHKYDKGSDSEWRIVLVGNDYVYNELLKEKFQFGKIHLKPFVPYDAYIDILSTVSFVLIPLNKSDFNSSKTAIRLMDAAVAGSSALFSPVGEYKEVQKELDILGVQFDFDFWLENIGEFDQFRDSYATNVTMFQDALKNSHGREASLRKYEAFIGDFLDYKLDQN